MYKNLKRPLRRTIRLRPVTDSQITLLDERTTCFVDVQKLMEKRIHKIPVRVTNIPGNVKAIVIPSHFSLVVQGGVNLVAPITEKDIVAFIDYRRYRNAKENDYPAYIEPIPGIEFRDYDPKRFKVILERE
jgi:hypothetical protein